MPRPGRAVGWLRPQRLVCAGRPTSEAGAMTREFDPQFFMREDVPVDGPLRELVGYGEHPPKVRWKDGARVAVQIVVNVEEGSEKTFAMGDGTNDGYHEFPGRRRGAARPRGRVVLRVRLARRHLAALPGLRRGRHPGHPLHRGGGPRAQSRGRREARSPRRRGGRPRLPLVEPLRDEPRRGARGDPPRGRSRSSGRPARARSAGTAAR